PGAVQEKDGAGPSGYTWVNRHVTQPPPQISASAFSTAAVAFACRSGNCDQVHAVSNVSTITAIDTSASRPYGARRNELRHAPTALSLPAGLSESGPADRTS